MNYKEARMYLEQASVYGSVLGLENMLEMLRRLDHPQNDLKFIHIAGTNGKGSVLAYLSTILKEAGYKVGRYISPTIFGYRERIQVNETHIDKEAFARLFTKIANVMQQMVEAGNTHPTVFEIETVLGFLYFKECRCDLVVLETGLGGLLDATNVIHTSIMEILTPIGMDHMGVLGNTLKEIAENKAGIIKPNTYVVTAGQRPEVMDVIQKTCLEKACQLNVVDHTLIRNLKYGYEQQQFSYKEFQDVQIPLAGTYQIANAVVALEAVIGLNRLGYQIDHQEIKNGMARTKWRGRFTVLQKEPLFIIDGAHNQDGAKVLKESIEQYFQGKKLYYIMGTFKDKEYNEMIHMTAPMAEHIFAIETPENERALPAVKLAEAITRINPHVHTAADIKSAVKESMDMARKEDVILAFGSLSFLGEITKALDTIRR